MNRWTWTFETMERWNLMRPRGVLVSYSLDTSKNPFSCSGTLISENWVLAHGSLLEPLVWKTEEFVSLGKDLKAGVLATNRWRKPLEFSVSWESAGTKSVVAPCCGGKFLPNGNDGAEHMPLPFETGVSRVRKARLAAAWKCPLLMELFEGILSSWRFSETPRAENVVVPDEELFPLLLLLKIQGCVDYADESTVSEPLDALRSFVKILALPERGQEVEIESTPFGNPVFMNSVTTGVISNILGPMKSLLITDANAVIGCEGGPIFIRYKSGHRAICGIVVAPLSWCRGEWVGYTLGVSLLPCLYPLLDPLDCKNANFSSPVSSPGIIELLDRSVVVVRCGSGWGSGVLVDKTTGTFLTCSHVVKEAPNSKITMWHPTFSVRGELVYKTSDSTPYDLAIVCVDPRETSGLENVTIGDVVIKKSDEVVCAGFPLISSRDQPLMYPTVTRGRVSHVSAGMLQTSCCIQSGASGGPVASYPGGELVGIVVCNATSASRKALFPRVNMAVPAFVFKGPIQEYLRTKDIKSLTPLENRNNRIQQKWNLNLTPSAHL